ncbi:hypothetical protein, variant [Aphanomyces invadans]|uniref:Uncharacterized protein n=1 Tax=Aphanomyces invadans TaxID=157072 RepID=A0A024TUU1_9STRA|nr:hypothetical protein, variant [Aphanomyces invadans]ETV97803.1 hypothetical protein, variant [Aphanomyces invadans]|eukprot:XP_008873364.1 hypothetical protein, variant [Aphanomyces invadans]
MHQVSARVLARQAAHWHAHGAKSAPMSLRFFSSKSDNDDTTASHSVSDHKETGNSLPPDRTPSLTDLPDRQLQQLVTNVYAAVEEDLKSSWSRVLAVQTVTDNRLRQNAYVLAQLGTDISVAPTDTAEAENLLDDGSSRIETDFPIVGGQAKARVCVKAVIDTDNCMHFSQFLYVNDDTGESYDFMCPMEQLTGIRLDSDLKEIKTPPPSIF